MTFALRKTVAPSPSSRADQSGGIAPTIQPVTSWPTTKLLQDFAMPASGATATAQVADSSIFWIGQRVYLASIGWFEIVGGNPSPRS